MKTIENLINQKRALTIVYNNKNKTIKKYASILDFSSRTTSKIIQRMLDDDIKFGCSYCKWNETIGDIHHINGRKIDDPDNLDNLCYLCPNCHRKVHKGLIKKEELISFKNQIGDKWKKYALSYKVKSDNNFNYRKEIDLINYQIKKIKKHEIQTILSELKNSQIDFTNYGWVKEASKIIEVTPQKVGKWLQREDKEFYDNCYKRT